MTATSDRFAELAKDFFGRDRIGPRLLLELRAGRHEAARALLRESQARDLERRLRQAPRDVAP